MTSYDSASRGMEALFSRNGGWIPNAMFIIPMAMFLSSQAESAVPEEWRLVSERDVYISQPPISIPRRVILYLLIPVSFCFHSDTKIVPCRNKSLKHHGTFVLSRSLHLSWIGCCPFKGRMAVSVDLPAAYRPLRSNQRKRDGLR